MEFKLSYTSLERSNLYVNYAFDSLLAYSVSKQIYSFLKEIPNEKSNENGINRPSRRSLNYYEIMQKSYFDVIIYSALAIESFINKLGFCIYGKEYSTKIIHKKKTLERCSINIKIQHIIHYLYNKSFDYHSSENKLLKLLFTNRDDLIHDKPEIYDGVAFIFEKENRIERINPEEVFQVLFLINNLFIGYKYKDSPVHFISDIIENKYSLLIKEIKLAIDGNLPFCEAKFSDIYLYKCYLRNTIGYEIPVELNDNLIIKARA